MNKKALKAFLFASIIVALVSLTTLAASVGITGSVAANIETGEVNINYASSGMADDDQLTVVVYKYNEETSAEPDVNNIVYIDQAAKKDLNGTFSFKMKDGVKVGTACRVLVGGEGVTTPGYMDFSYGKKVSVNKPTEGLAEVSKPEAGASETVEITIVPPMGYYISSVMEGNNPITGSFDAYRGGKYTYRGTENVNFSVTFAEITTVPGTNNAGMTSTDVFTLPEVFKGKYQESDEYSVAVAFGRVKSTTNVAEYGIYLTYQDGTEVRVNNYDPHFKATKLNGNGQFGVIFQQMDPGEYYAQSYIKYNDGTIEYGIKVPFEVVE